MSFRPLTLRSISLPSSDLSMGEEYDPYVWHTGFVKARVRQIEEDLSRTVKDFVASEWDVHSMISLDTKRIAPDGNDYQLVFISSSAASQDSDMEEGAADTYLSNSFQHRMMAEAEDAYPLSRTARDEVDWEMSTSSSNDERDVPSDDDIDFMSRTTPVNVPNLYNFVAEQSAFDLPDDSLSQLGECEDGRGSQMTGCCSLSDTDESGFSGNVLPTINSYTLQREDLHRSERNGDILNGMPSEFYPCAAKKSICEHREAIDGANDVFISEEENVEYEGRKNRITARSSLDQNGKFTQEQKRELVETQDFFKNVPCDKTARLTESSSEERCENHQFIVQGEANRNSKFTGRQTDTEADSAFHQRTASLKKPWSGKKIKSVDQREGEKHPLGNDAESHRDQETSRLSNCGHLNLHQGSFSADNVTLRSLSQMGEIEYSHKMHARRCHLRGTISDLFMEQPRLLPLGFVMDYMRLHFPFHMDVLHHHELVTSHHTCIKDWRASPGTKCCEPAGLLENEAYHKNNALLLDRESHANGTAGIPNRTISAIVKSADRKASTERPKHVRHLHDVPIWTTSAGQIFADDGQLMSISGDTLTYLTDLTEIVNSNFSFQDALEILVTNVTSADTDASKLGGRNFLDVSESSSGAHISLQRQTNVKYINLHYKELNFESKFIFVNLLGASCLISLPATENANLWNENLLQNLQLLKCASSAHGCSHTPLKGHGTVHCTPLHLYEENKLFLDISSITEKILEGCTKSAIIRDIATENYTPGEEQDQKINSFPIDIETQENLRGNLLEIKVAVQAPSSSDVNIDEVLDCRKRTPISVDSYISSHSYLTETDCAGLMDGAFHQSPPLVSFNRKPKPTLKSRCSETPEGIHNSQCRMADVSSTGENPAPETGVIDTRPGTTSETCSAAFERLCSSGAALESKPRPFPRLAVTVPADPRAAKRGSSTRGPVRAAATESPLPCVPLSNALSEPALNSDAVWLPHDAVKDTLRCFSVCPVDYSCDGSETVADYSCPEVDMHEPGGVREVKSIVDRAADPDRNSTSTGARESYSRQTPEKRGMSLDEPYGYDGSNANKMYGGKVSQLKKFFDSGAEYPPNTKHDRTSGSACVKESICSDSGMEHTFPATDIPFFEAVPSRGRQGNDQCNKAERTSGEENYVLTVSNELFSGDNANSPNYEYDHTVGSGLKNQNEVHNRTSPNFNFSSKKGILWDAQNLSSSNMSKEEIIESHQSELFDSSVDTVASPTRELNNLIITSRAELSKIEPHHLNPKSTLENYFTYGFDSSKSSQYHANSSGSDNMNCQEQRTPSEEHSINHPDISYSCHDSESLTDKERLRNDDLYRECDGDEMYDDLDALSDPSEDEEESRYFSLSSSALYSQPSYALHTIIEESCEESERDSRSSTPTNNEPTSKLHRYFSWDIINDPELNNLDVDDSSTVFSDSLSENSDVLNAEKEIESPRLISSRLEKYFTSGLLGNDDNFYHDDTEYADDASVSDFEEENAYHKISRSALLSSLESKPFHIHSSGDIKSTQNSNLIYEKEVMHLDQAKEENFLTDHEDRDRKVIKLSNGDFDYACATSSEEGINDDSVTCKSNDNIDQVNKIVVKDVNDHINDNNSALGVESSEVNMVVDTSLKLSPINCDASVEDCYVKLDVFCEESETKVSHSHEMQNLDISENLVVSRKAADKKMDLNEISDSFDDNAQAIMKKIIFHLSDTLSNSQSAELGYVSAWKILETEIERLMQSVSPLSVAENSNSCNSSTIGSSNSDYGSDTIDSTECLTTDEDDNCLDSKSNYLNPFGSSQKSTLHKIVCESSFNGILCISEETLEIWRKLMLSLKKDKLSLLRSNNDEYTRARVYIQDQIIALMHTVTTSHAVPPTDDELTSVLSVPCSLCPLEESKPPINVSASEESKGNEIDLNLSINESEIDKQTITADYFHSVLDEGISVDSTENLNGDLKNVLEMKNHEADNLCYSNSYSLNESDNSFHERTSCEIQDLEDCEVSIEFLDVMQQKNETTGILVSDSVNVNDGTERLSSDVEVHSAEQSGTHVDHDECSPFSVYVDIQLGDKTSTVTERNIAEDLNCVKHSLSPATDDSESFSSPLEDNCRSEVIDSNSGHYTSQERISTESNLTDLKENVKCDISSEANIQSAEETKDSHDVHRDTGYYSFRSSDDSIISSSDSHSEHPDPATKQEVSDHENSDIGKSSSDVSESHKDLSNMLSHSTNNIPQSISDVDAKFCTLQPKSSVSKVSMNPKASAPGTSRPLAAFFSPSAVFKRLTTTKSYATPSEISVPSKYFKKYGRSCSVDDESLFGARSMPHLNLPNLIEPHSYADSDRDSCLTLNDELVAKHKFSNYGHSVLSLGSHSASMTSVYSAAGGRHFGYVSVSGDVLFGLNYNQKSQMMEVFVKQCRNLAAVDPKRNKSDPYVKVYLLPDKTKGGKRKTKTKKNTLNPIFNELLRFPVLKHELESRTLWLSVWNSDLFGRNDFLGEIMLALGYRLLDSPTLRWYPLQERMESLTSPLKYKGELFLALKYVPKDLSLESRFRPAPVISLKGALHVLVKEARNIAATRSNGTSDPFCKSYLLPDKTKISKQKTPVVKKTQHPKWYYTVIYEDLSIDELKERSLELTLWDHDKITSNEFMGGVRLNTGTGLYHGVPVEWMDSHKDETTLWQAMLERPNMWVDGSLPLRPTMQFIRN